jgi:hypothetical protein
MRGWRLICYATAIWALVLLLLVIVLGMLGST